jgi:sigma-B regulation protein RsbU (phosphoserine phosphatase)
MDFEPKRYYRRFGTLLSNIEASSVQELLPQVLREVVSNVGEDFGIRSGRLYHEEAGGFRLVLDLGSKDRNVTGLLIPADYGPIQMLLRRGVAIFDRRVEGLDPALEDRLGGVDSAAVLIESRPRSILAFGLRPGSSRDRLEFGLKAIQSTLHHRLRWESVSLSMQQTLEIQQGLLPQERPEFAGYDISAVSLAAELVGGDFFDLSLQSSDVLSLAIGDASGHGLPAALQARDVVIGLRMGIEHQLKMVPTIQKLNRVISRSSISSRFVSLFYGELEQNGNLFYINAGHPPPLLIGYDQVRSLTVGGSILGPLPEIQYKRGFVHVDRGSTLLLYTDGITEVRNARGEEFGMEGIVEQVKPGDTRSAREILEGLLEAARCFGGGAPFRDDATLLVVQRQA